MAGNRCVPIGLAAVLTAASPERANSQSSIDSYYRFLGDEPSAAEPDWANDAQGLAHDADHWFITNNQGEIWKVPVSSNLCCTAADDPGVTVLWINLVAELKGYEKFKDPVCRPFQGIEYLFVPVEGEGVPGAVAVFRTDTLAYLDHRTHRDGNGNNDAHVRSSWCAIDATGHLFLPYDFENASGLIEYLIDWPSLGQGNLVTEFVRT